MKKIVYLITILIATLQLLLTQTMNIHTKSGITPFNLSEIDSITFINFFDDSIPDWGEVLVEEDWESCINSQWVGDCSSWQTWANGSNASDFYITNETSASGEKSLHVSGSGSCWEGSIYKPISGEHLLVKSMIKASGEGPNGCHHRQNGIEINVVGWSFEMPYGDSNGGLMAYAAGAGSYFAIDGFENSVGKWYYVAVEVNYISGIARFWLDGKLVWTTNFDTNAIVERVWARSGEGSGWFDNIFVIDLEKK